MSPHPPNIEDLTELLQDRTPGSWFVRIERDHVGNEDFYIDTDDETGGRHWPHIGSRGFCHVEGKAYDCVVADAKLMAAAPALALKVLELQAQVEKLSGSPSPFASWALTDLGYQPQETA